MKAAKLGQEQEQDQEEGQFGCTRTHSLVVASLEKARIGGIWDVERHCGKTVRLEKAHTRARVVRLRW